jgi:CRP/FNR family transcriptional regulator, cyclic AMP receptor protein
MHDNPRANDEEQELTQTERMDEEEEQRSGYAPAEAADGDEER